MITLMYVCLFLGAAVPSKEKLPVGAVKCQMSTWIINLDISRSSNSMQYLFSSQTNIKTYQQQSPAELKPGALLKPVTLWPLKALR